MTTITTSKIATEARGPNAARNARPNSLTKFGHGLCLITTAAGTKSWRYDYRLRGVHKVATLGRYPDLTVEAARDARDAIARSLREGGDPTAVKAQRKAAAAMTISVVAAAWVEAERAGWSADYAHHTTLRLKNHILPAIGDLPITEASDAIETLCRSLSLKYRAQAVLVKHNLQCMFDYAIYKKWSTENPVRRGAKWLPSRRADKAREVTRAAVKTIEEARDVLRTVETTCNSPFLKLAHRLIALTAVRKMEGIEAQWSEISEAADGSMTWTIPGERMKGRRGEKRDHAIPLAPQAADIFRAADRLAFELHGTRRSGPVFPGRGAAGCLDRSALNDLYTRAQLCASHSVHGWRSTFSTILNERDHTAFRLVDVMLAHKAFGAVEAHYNKAQFADARRQLATQWADMLLIGAPTAFELAGIEAANSNIVQLREAA